MVEYCPKCKTALQISNSYYKTTGDDSPDTPTIVTLCMEQICVNPACENHDGRIVDTIENIIYERGHKAM